MQTVGRYEIIGELGRGAMGVVYKAKDPTIGRTVALKTMRLDVSGLDSAEILRRFQNEARAAGLLNHPNIVTIYDAGEHEGSFYIAMEFIEGTTLQDSLAVKHLLPPDEAIRLSRDICKGLDYAHSHGIVHRDVKPANIMITTQGAVKIMDFGIAKAGGSMTMTGQVLGTPNYMSPEQVKGRVLDGRSDLFSFGVILYEMLTGEKPFGGQSITTIIYKIVNEEPIPPRELDVTIHPGLSTVVVKALAKTPDERYQSGADLVHDLENYKQAGTMLNATAVLPRPVPVTSPEKTEVLPMRVVSGSTVRAAEPAPIKKPVPLRPAAAQRSGRKSGLITFLVTVLVLGAAVGGYALYRTRVKMQQLESEINMAEAQAAKPQPSVGQPSATPVPAASPENMTTPADSGITSDSTTTTPAEKEPDPFKPKKAPAGGQKTELSLSSQPTGATVEVDGQSKPGWVTPFKVLHLAAGTHNVVFSKDGYAQATRRVEAAGKNLSVAVELSPAAKVIVGSNPAGAAIWLDGKDSGAATPSQLTIAKGQHQISIKKAGYKDAFWEGNLAQGQVVNFAPVLLSMNQQSEKGPGFLSRILGGDSVPDGKGLVHIRTVPKGATIIINGRVAPKKTDAKWPADPGVYSIDLQLTGYKTVHRNVQVELGKVKNIDEFLDKQ